MKTIFEKDEHATNTRKWRLRASKRDQADDYYYWIIVKNLEILLEIGLHIATVMLFTEHPFSSVLLSNDKVIG